MLNRLSKNHIPGLDGMRGISAFLVFCAHAGLLPRQYGALGVAVFFVLSGFLITWLLLKEDQASGTVSLKAFYMRRSLRIFPAFYVFWLVCVMAASGAGSQVSGREIASSFLYCGDYYNALKQLVDPGVRNIMGMTWSLGVEEKFYLIWPWVFVRYRRNLDTLRWLVAAGLVAAVAYRTVVWLGANPPQDYLRYAFESRLDNILYGCLLAILVKSGRHERWLAAAAGNPVLPFVPAAGLVASVYLEERLGPGFHYLLGMPLDAILITVLLVQMVSLSGRGIWQWLEWKPLRFGGKISYSVYLYHFTVITLVERTLRDYRWSVQLMAAFALTVGAATISYLLVEKPFLRLKEHFSSSGHAVQRRYSEAAG